MTELTLRLVRHGETDWARDQRYTGHTDVPLNDTGTAQAMALRPLATEPFASVWCSDLARCVETARLMGVDATPTAALREFDFGEIEGRRWDDLDAATQAGLLAFDGFAAPGGESVVDFGIRIDTFVAGLGPGRHLLVTHGGVIRHQLRRLDRDERVDPGHWRDVVLRRR